MENNVFGDPGPDYGLWWRRVGAQLIDGLITTGLAVIGVVLIVLIGTTLPDALAILINVILVIAIIVALTLYAPILMRRQGETNGQTWGKQAMKIRVIRDQEETPYTFGPAFIRQFLVIGLLFGGLGAAFAGIPLLADYLWPLWDKQNRALHDMVVDSRVIRVAGPVL